MKSLIQKLVETPGPSGYEAQIRQVIRGEVEPLADEVWVDALGNLIARKGGAREGGGPSGKRVMLVAHMDEIGVMVTHIDEQGFARFMPVGGVNPRNLPGGRVQFLNGAEAVIGVDRLDDANRVASFEQLFLDFGVSSRSECPVRVGDAAVFHRTMIDLGERLVAKTLDNRAGVAVLIEALRQISAQGGSPHELFFVFSTQEEVGSRGAEPAAYGIEPDLGLVVDVTRTGDTPQNRRIAVQMGQGPAIKVRDQRMLSDPRVVDWMRRTAEDAGLPYQMEILESGWTDATPLQVSRLGVPVGGLALPCRYIHSPSEMVDLADLENGLRLLVELLRRPVELNEV